MTVAIAERDPAARAPVLATSAADRLIWRMAGEIADGAVVATGVASPLALLAIALARATHAPRLTYLACVGSLNPAVSRLFGSSEDLAYLAGLSADAAPVLAGDPHTRALVAGRFERPDALLGWNLALARAEVAGTR